MIIPNRAAQNKQRGRMLPAGRQFDMAGLNYVIVNEKNGDQNVNFEK